MDPYWQIQHCYAIVSMSVKLFLTLLHKVQPLKNCQFCSRCYVNMPNMFHHQNACQFCTPKSLTAFSASENVSYSTPIFNSTAIFTTNTDYSKTLFGILCTSMVTSLWDKELIERIQHRFTRMFPELRKLPYLKRLEYRKLWTLEERNLIKVCKSNLRHHFFSERVINNWNNLDN